MIVSPVCRIAAGLIPLALIGAEAPRPAAAPTATTTATTIVYVGTHGDSIQAARLDEADGTLTPLGTAATVERPTWLVSDRRRRLVYTVSETGNGGAAHGGVIALTMAAEPGRLAEINRVDSGGGGATFLAYAPQLSRLFVANYGSGQVAAIAVAPDGRLSPPSAIVANYGTGPSPRQKSPHAHAVAVDRSGRYVLSADLGADRVFVYRYDAAAGSLAPADPPFVQLPAGSGPRHLVFSRDGRFLYVDTELSAEMRSFRWDGRAGRLTPMQSIGVDKGDHAGPRSAAEIALAADGRHLYVSDRGEDQLVVYDVDPGTGAIRETQRLSCGGHVPWSFAISPGGRWLIVANEASDALSVFGVDAATGALAPTTKTLAVGKPVSIAYGETVTAGEPARRVHAGGTP